MALQKILNQSQPQTLQIGTIMLYIGGVFGLLGALGGAGAGVAALVAIGGAVGAYGLANDQKWGYFTAVGCAAFAALLALVLLASDFNTSYLINFIIDGAIFVVLIHPMSRSYVKTWLK